MSHCFSAFFVIYHIHNLLTEDFREICVLYQRMLFHAKKEEIVAAKDTCFDRYSAVGCGWSNEEFVREKIIEKTCIQRLL